LVATVDASPKTIDSPLEKFLAFYVALMDHRQPSGVDDLPGHRIDHLVDGVPGRWNIWIQTASVCGCRDGDKTGSFSID